MKNEIGFRDHVYPTNSLSGVYLNTLTVVRDDGDDTRFLTRTEWMEVQRRVEQ